MELVLSNHHDIFFPFIYLNFLISLCRICHFYQRLRTALFDGGEKTKIKKKKRERKREKKRKEEQTSSQKYFEPSCLVRKKVS